MLTLSSHSTNRGFSWKPLNRVPSEISRILVAARGKSALETTVLGTPAVPLFPNFVLGSPFGSCTVGNIVPLLRGYWGTWPLLGVSPYLAPNYIPNPGNPAKAIDPYMNYGLNLGWGDL